MTYDRMIIPKDSEPIKLHEEPTKDSWGEWDKNFYGKLQEHAKGSQERHVAEVNKSFNGIAKAMAKHDEATQLMWSKVVSALPDWARRGANLPNKPGYWRVESRPALVLWVDEEGQAWHGEERWDNDGSYEVGDGDWEQLAPIATPE